MSVRLASWTRSAICRGGLRVAAAGLALFAAPHPAVAATQLDARFPVIENLDQPGVLSHYAYVNQPVTARIGPSWDAPRVGRLTTKTEDRTDELVAIQARTIDKDGRRWLKVSLPILPHGTTGWVPSSALGEITKVRTWLKVDRARLRLTLVRSGHVILRVPIAIGRSNWPTPSGRFYIRNRLTGPGLGAMYGPLAFGTSARSSVLTDWPGGGVIGIHGTNQPRRIPGRISHGCIRLRNADILRLGRKLPLGTPITIT
jgi:lipoprotein-anchoring transpeptidase ErfK/SrfK